MLVISIALLLLLPSIYSVINTVVATGSPPPSPPVLSSEHTVSPAQPKPSAVLTSNVNHWLLLPGKSSSTTLSPVVTELRRRRVLFEVLKLASFASVHSLPGSSPTRPKLSTITSALVSTSASSPLK